VTGIQTITAIPEERFRRPIAHQLREALVEGCGTLHIEGVVGDLVEDRRSQLDRVSTDRRGQQRVLEPPEGREGPGWSQIDIIASGGKPVRLSAGGAGIEEPLVRYSPNDGILPGVRADAVLRRGLQDEEEGVPPDVRVRCVRLLGLEAETRSIVASVQHQPQILTQHRVGGTVPDQFRDGLA
jgi:hypothetical protein